MIITLCAGATDQDIAQLRTDLLLAGYESYRCRLQGRVTLAVPGADRDRLDRVTKGRPVVTGIGDPGTLSPLGSRVAAAGDSTVPLAPGLSVGGKDFVVAAGPCAVESKTQLDTIADAVADSGAVVLRGGAYKPRTSPYAFQGLGPPGLELLAATSRRTGLPVVTEVLEPGDVERVAASTHVLQIGARNAQNFPLIREAGRSGLPVLLKRGFSCTVDEWLHAAEYVLREGNPHVLLCERGIRTFESRSRFTPDLMAVAVVKRLSHLPVIVDPSHATGSPDLVVPMTLAAAAAGADGVLIDVHHDPASALCDGGQALTPENFRSLMGRLGALLPALGRRLPLSQPVAPPLSARDRTRVPALSVS